jgi:hypothetical protein
MKGLTGHSRPQNFTEPFPRVVSVYFLKAAAATHLKQKRRNVEPLGQSSFL